MTRFFVEAHQIGDHHVRLTGPDAHHILRVLRKQTGDGLIAVGPDGTEFQLEITGTEPVEPAVVARVMARRQPHREPLLRVTIAQALLKGDKMDWVIAKGTELGAAAFLPYACGRSVVRLGEDKARRRMQRWQRVATAAARQSGRTHVPAVEPVMDMTGLVERVTASPGPVLLAWEGETQRGLFDALGQVWGAPAPEGLATPAEALLVIGPEGGFDREEVTSLREAGAVAVTLGPLIFRAETVAPAVLGMMLYHVGDLGRSRQV